LAKKKQELDRLLEKIKNDSDERGYKYKYKYKYKYTHKPLYKEYDNYTNSINKPFFINKIYDKYHILLSFDNNTKVSYFNDEILISLEDADLKAIFYEENLDAFNLYLNKLLALTR
jgi:hypothetical protein